VLIVPSWYTSKPLADKRSIKYFTGRIPTELGRCSAMKALGLSGNKLNGTSILCSSCPVWYTSKPSAEKRSITKIAGPIPTELGRCSNMSGLWLDGNQLSGKSILCSSCPVWYTSKPANDNRSINYFTGRIPTELGRCSAMNNLDLQVNKLTGSSILCSSCPVWTRVNRRLKNVQSQKLQVQFRPSWCAAAL
jgi:hypothetical protein